MKILIAYYSKGGSTEKTALAIKKELEARNHAVDLEKITPAKEHGFFAWQITSLLFRFCKINEPAIKTVSRYDVVCVGSPSWIKLPPPIRTYLNQLDGLRHKKVFLFTTAFALPQVEWYLPHTYLLEMTFSKLIERKRGKVLGGVSFSKVFKKWNFNSEYGKKTIANFCSRVGRIEVSYKEYSLKRQEVSENRLVVITSLILIILALIFQVCSAILQKQIVGWIDFANLFILAGFFYFLMIVSLQSKKAIWLGKFLASGFLILCWTLLIMIFKPNGEWAVIWGYALLLMAIFYFRNLKAIIFSGILIFLSYAYLFFNYSIKSVLAPQLDIPFIFFGILVTALVSRSLQKNFLELLAAKDETEEARITLEIKISARTRELKELADSLENKVDERTQELQGKIEELEKFNKLAIGRELKMVELKEQIKNLEADLNKK